MENFPVTYHHWTLGPVSGVGGSIVPDAVVGRRRLAWEIPVSASKTTSRPVSEIQLYQLFNNANNTFRTPGLHENGHLARDGHPNSFAGHEDTVETILSKFEDYCSVKKNEAMTLKELMKLCDFKIDEDWILKSRVVLRIEKKDVQERLLREDL
ncbi:Uncharacterized protein FWK35_00006867 [Aphis craccivora]|uniref:Uncharacterized protein n=1 Tax=Aphis craccivora TaxID=307492 RepID=A0A6G0ZQ11_APHCR|nr:Uncharacterized protein FWK35_00006867 [Aphis craccivora]